MNTNRWQLQHVLRLPQKYVIQCNAFLSVSFDFDDNFFKANIIAEICIYSTYLVFIYSPNHDVITEKNISSPYGTLHSHKILFISTTLLERIEIRTIHQAIFKYV